MEYGDKLRSLRAMHKVSQEKLASHLGVSRTFIYYLEENLALPAPVMAEKIDRYFDEKVSEAQPAALAA